MFVVDHAEGAGVPPEIARLLDPIEPSSYHYWDLKRENGQTGEFEAGPGTTVYCVRGVEHGHTPIEDWACFEWRSVPREGARDGHLFREL